MFCSSSLFPMRIQNSESSCVDPFRPYIKESVQFSECFIKTYACPKFNTDCTHSTQRLWDLYWPYNVSVEDFPYCYTLLCAPYTRITQICDHPWWTQCKVAILGFPISVFKISTKLAKMAWNWSLNILYWSINAEYAPATLHWARHGWSHI